MWDDNAQGILSGLIAFVKLAEPPENQNLIRVREILRTDEIKNAAEVMKEHSECGGIMQSAAAILGSEKGEDFLANARENTKWLDSLPMQTALIGGDETRTFKLSDLKTKDTTIFLVLPPNYLSQHGRFLRLFVRCSIEAMGQKLPTGGLLGKRCLFILDEFFSLGKIDEIQKAAGLMPGMGVHLWPFLHDLGQLTTLYGVEGAQTFFGNSDLHQFFANTDQPTLQFMSQLSGVVDVDEAGLPPIMPASMTGMGGGIVGSMMQGSRTRSTQLLGAGLGGLSQAATSAINSAAQAQYQNEMNEYQQRMAKAGKPRITPDQMADLVKRRDDVVADKMYCVLNGTDKIWVKPLPFFRGSPIDIQAQQEELEAQQIAQKAAYDELKLSWNNRLFIAFFAGVFLYSIGLAQLILKTLFRSGAFAYGHGIALLLNGGTCAFFHWV